ncbi:anaerobic ribonucleoside-triphosphate reductase activating protein [Diplocloster hominis]|uniref:anaerobic ribonucleoside-triphosphate reductase activating protein n=1 Tax=Diplocloster hominis TaxID=3079010 RepID=UPI0031BBA5F3
MQIHGLNKTTLLDYPGHVAATLFLGSCNFRCPFCHNAGLVLDPASEPVIPLIDVFGFLKKRRGILDGVCISGGEPTLQEELPDLIHTIRDLGYKIKLDTNGSRPEVLRNLLDEHLLDCVAMDIKSSPENYALVAGISGLDIKKIEESIQLLKDSPISYEFRTTVADELHTDQDFYSIRDWLNGSRAYYLQPYKDSEYVIQEGFHAPSRETLERWRDICAEKIGTVQIRGLD